MQDNFELELDALEADEPELSEEFEFESGASTESPFDEAEEMELAAELLGMTDEAELDQFLGKLIRRAGRAAGKFISSPAGRALGGILKGAARKALPIVGSALGTAIGGPAGGAIGGKLASTAGKIFGLELEGLSPEDQEFETARRFVRFAGAAAKHTALASPHVSPQQAVQTAVAAAARRLAPGLLSKPASSISPTTLGRGRSGRWIRRGRHIVVLNG